MHNKADRGHKLTVGKRRHTKIPIMTPKAPSKASYLLQVHLTTEVVVGRGRQVVLMRRPH